METGDVLVCLKSMPFLLSMSSISAAPAERGEKVETIMETENMIYLSIVQRIQLNISGLFRRSGFMSSVNQIRK